MRVVTLMLAIAGLSACDSKPVDRTTVEATPAALTFDGAASTDPAARLTHGARLAVVLGCQGCHGDNLQGTNVTEDDPAAGDIYAPNLTVILADYSDADLERVIRRGVPKDGREFWFMPSESFPFLEDADLAALIAHLRTITPAGRPLPPIRKGPAYEKDIAEGIYGNAAEMIRRYAADPPADLGPEHAYGRHLSQIVCAECHNAALQGFKNFTPDLDLAGAYSEAELETLLTTGKGKAKPDLGLMSESARHRFSKLTPRERGAIIAYVKARADRPQ